MSDIASPEDTGSNEDNGSNEDTDSPEDTGSDDVIEQGSSGAAPWWSPSAAADRARAPPRRSRSAWPANRSHDSAWRSHARHGSSHGS